MIVTIIARYPEHATALEALIATYIQYPDGRLIDRNRPRTTMLIPPDLDAATRVLPATDVVSCPVIIDRATRDVQSLYVF
jgi:hypothetical protein